MTNAEYLNLVLQDLNEILQAGLSLHPKEKEELQDLLYDIDDLLEDL